MAAGCKADQKKLGGALAADDYLVDVILQLLQGIRAF